MHAVARVRVARGLMVVALAKRRASNFFVFAAFWGLSVQIEGAGYNGGALRAIFNILVADCSVATCATSCNFEKT